MIPASAVPCSTSSSRPRLSAREITSALVEQLESAAAAPTVLLEVPCPGGRIDILAVSEEIDGYEVKSDLDSLVRVNAQLSMFSRFCTRLTFVSGARHAVDLLSMLPIWCGVQVVVTEAGAIRFITLRPPRRSPRPENLASAHLLYRHEIAALINAGRSDATRGELSKALAESLPYHQLRHRIATTLMLRNGKAAAPSASCDD